MMQLFPHVYLMQQKMEHNKRMMEQMNKDSGNVYQDSEALKKSGLLQLITTPEGRLKFQNLAIRVQESRKKVEEEVSDWSSEKKMQFFDSFIDHPILKEIGDNDGEKDPIDKFKTFLDMGESDLQDMLRLLYVMSKDTAGELVSKLKSNMTQKENENLANNSNTMNNLLATMGSLTSFNKFAGAQSHSHSHSHSHNHDHHHGGAKPSSNPDISYGIADSMDR